MMTTGNEEFSKGNGSCSLPGGFLLQLRNVRHVEHHSEEEQRLVAKLVQLLLEGLLQFHPAVGRGLGLPVEPEPKVMRLGWGRGW